MGPLAAILVYGYLFVVAGIGIAAARRGADANDFVAGERAFGPIVLYFVLGATMFSAYALLGTPQRVVAKGSEVFYILAYGSVGLVPLFYVGARVRRIGARCGYLTQAELIGARFESRTVVLLMGLGALASFFPYLLIQLKAAGIVLSQVSPALSRTEGAAIVAFVVGFYVIVGGVRGVGWTNVLQGVAMLVIVWGLGVWIPTALYGGIPELFDRVVATRPDALTLPGPGPTSDSQWTAEILVSVLGFAVWPHLFMKSFTARSARLVQWSVVAYPSFLFFILPLVFLGYVALLEGGPANDGVLLWLVGHPELGAGAAISGLVAFAVLAASMSTLDALLHAAGSVAVRDVVVRALGVALDERAQVRWMRAAIAGVALCVTLTLAVVGDTSVVDLLLIGYDVIVQFVPVVYLGLFWRGARRRGAIAGLATGLGAVALLSLAPQLNPWAIRPGAPALVLNALALVVFSRRASPTSRETLRAFELAGPR